MVIKLIKFSQIIFCTKKKGSKRENLIKFDEVSPDGNNFRPLL